MDTLKNLCCLQQTYRLLKKALGEPEEGEDYWPLAEIIVNKFDELMQSAPANTATATVRQQFCLLVNDVEPDEVEDDWSLSREWCNQLYDLLARFRLLNIKDFIHEGAQIATKLEDESKAAAAAASEASRQQALATLATEKTRLTPEDRYSLILLAQQTSGSVDLSATMSVQDDFLEDSGEVELREFEPTFLRGKIRKHAVSYRQPRQQQTNRPFGQLSRKGGLLMTAEDEDQRTQLERIADKQDEVAKQRRIVLKMTAEERQQHAPQIEHTEAPQESRPQPLGLELGELPEERGGGIRSTKDLPKRLPPWMKPGPGGMVSFGPKSSLALKEVRDSLPIARYKESIIANVANTAVTVLVGEPGSGKTTQLTQYLVDAGYHRKGLIGCTQPRRVAATSVAERVAEEFGCQLGNEVGYSVRFKDRTSPLTIIRYMTDGMLLREALLDETFSRYSVIILDEAHERSVNTDVLLGMMKRALLRRSDLKVIVTSATLETEKFCNFFSSPNPVLIPGKVFPLSIRYDEPSDDYVDAALRTVMGIHLEQPPGDIIVFLTGEAEIENAAQRLYNWTQQLEGVPELLILPIYSALPNEVQSKVFEKTPPLSRKVVLATNIAETSITIPDLYYVVDPGFCKMKRYNPRTGVEQLKVVPISQSQARQRAGRAARTGPGMCFRLYTEEQFTNDMAPATEPEIRRCNLSNVVLTLKAVGVGDILSFDFMDPPNRDALLEAMEKLYFLEALDDGGSLTTFGRRMSALPVEPTLGRTLLTALDMGCLPSVVTCVAMLMAPHVFQRPREKQEEADRKRSKFSHSDGDQLTLVTVYNAWVAAEETEQWARDNYINYRALKEARESRAQLADLLRSSGGKPERGVKNPTANTSILEEEVDTVAVRKAMAAGYFFQAAKRMNDGRYLTMSDRREVAIHPSSALFHIRPKYLVYHELVKTTRDFMRDVMTINPSWLVELAPTYYARPQAGRLTKEQMAERIDPQLRRWESGNDWRISRLRRRRK